MRDIATATLTGNLTREVELRELPSGTEVAEVRVASAIRWRSGDGWVDKADYFTVEVYGAQGRACAEYLAKGSRVAIDAELDWREWTDQQNNRREAVIFRARQVLFEGARPAKGSDSAGSVDEHSSPADAEAVAAATPGAGPASAEDLPF